MTEEIVPRETRKRRVPDADRRVHVPLRLPSYMAQWLSGHGAKSPRIVEAALLSAHPDLAHEKK